MTDSPFTRTPVAYAFPLERIGAHGTVVSIGSCFAADVIGTLLGCGFRGAQNPNGILYHPYSISDALQRIDLGYTLSDFFPYGGLWHSWMHHGSFSAPSAEEALEKAETARKTFLKALKKADACFVTLSSSVLYWHKPSKRYVANCHKVPGNEFERRLSSQTMCSASLLCACRKVRELNPDCRLIFTLSPVRHYPGELMLNSISKARALNAICDTLAKLENAAYFPAYEIQTDELRDYRFYADDMLHPSVQAQEYIRGRLLDACFTEQAKSIFQANLDRRRREAHVPLHPDLPAEADRAAAGPGKETP